jgi:hypothetical protein
MGGETELRHKSRFVIIIIIITTGALSPDALLILATLGRHPSVRLFGAALNRASGASLGEGDVCIAPRNVGGCRQPQMSTHNAFADGSAAPAHLCRHRLASGSSHIGARAPGCACPGKPRQRVHRGQQGARVVVFPHGGAHQDECPAHGSLRHCSARAARRARKPAHLRRRDCGDERFQLHVSERGS